MFYYDNAAKVLLAGCGRGDDRFSALDADQEV